MWSEGMGEMKWGKEEMKLRINENLDFERLEKEMVRKQSYDMEGNQGIRILVMVGYRNNWSIIVENNGRESWWRTMEETIWSRLYGVEALE